MGGRAPRPQSGLMYAQVGRDPPGASPQNYREASPARRSRLWLAACDGQGGSPMPSSFALRSLLWFVTLVAPSLALANTNGVASDDVELPEADIVGGRAAPSGKWPDAVAAMIGTTRSCTGT